MLNRTHIDSSLVCICAMLLRLCKKKKAESRRMNMKQSKGGIFLFYVAGSLLVLAFVLVWFEIIWT